MEKRQKHNKIAYNRAKRSTLSQQVTTLLLHVNICLTTGIHSSLLLIDLALLNQSLSDIENDHIV